MKLKKFNWFKKKDPKLSYEEIVQYLQLIEDVFVDLIDESDHRNINYKNIINSKGKMGPMQSMEIVQLEGDSYKRSVYRWEKNIHFPQFFVSMKFTMESDLYNSDDVWIYKEDRKSMILHVIQESLLGSKRLEDSGLTLINSEGGWHASKNTIQSGVGGSTGWMPIEDSETNSNILDQILHSDILKLVLVFKISKII